MFLNVERLCRKEEGTDTLRNVSFELAQIHKLAIAGATGSGKTRRLKIIAGQLQPASGSIFFQGEKLPGPEDKLMPGHPAIAYLSQYFELRNHYRVIEVLEMTSQLSHSDLSRICNVCDIDQFLKRWTHQLSGGERQRVALAKLLLTSPSLLLLDEPYSNLDMIHKNTLKKVIHALGEELGITCVLVSHEPSDVLSWADEIIVLKEGSVHQRDLPSVVYNHPVDEYTAALFGKYSVVPAASLKAFGADVSATNDGLFLVRPEQFSLSDGRGGIIGQVSFMGPYEELLIYIGDLEIIAHAPAGRFRIGQEVSIGYQF